MGPRESCLWRWSQADWVSPLALCPPRVMLSYRSSPERAHTILSAVSSRVWSWGFHQPVGVGGELISIRALGSHQGLYKWKGLSLKYNFNKDGTMLCSAMMKCVIKYRNRSNTFPLRFSGTKISRWKAEYLWELTKCEGDGRKKKSLTREIYLTRLINSLITARLINLGKRSKSVLPIHQMSCFQSSC